MPPFPGSVPIGASSGGSRLTISAILKQPTFVRAYLLRLADYLFVGEKLFRHVQDCPNGAVVYYTSTPLFNPQGSADLAEFEEVPAAIGALGTPSAAQARRKGLAIQVSEQMRTRNDVNALNVQLEQVRNTLVKDFDGKWMSLIDTNVATAAGQNGSTTSHVVASSSTWGSAATDVVRAAVAAAAKTITTEKRGFRPNVLVIDESTHWDLLGNPNIWQIYRGDAARENPQLATNDPYADKWRMLGMRVLITMDGNITAGDAYVLQSGVFGGISNERPLTATPWYPYRPKEEWRSDVTRVSAGFCDQPLALAKITGVR